MVKQTQHLSVFEAPDIFCQGCANSIKKALHKLAGVIEVSVDVPTKRVVVVHEIAAEAVQAALKRAGFAARLSQISERAAIAC